VAYSIVRYIYNLIVKVSFNERSSALFLQRFAMTTFSPAADCDSSGIPAPIVKLNRWMLVVGILTAFALQQPLITTLLLLIVAAAALFGRRGSLVFTVGTRLFRRQNAEALAAGRYDDRRVMRFNNAVAAILLGGAQTAFLIGATVVGWVLALAVVAAAALALAGFCVGCSIYTQWHIRSHLWKASRTG
jgi:uncharacterized protein DUF4395